MKEEVNTIESNQAGQEKSGTVVTADGKIESPKSSYDQMVDDKVKEAMAKFEKTEGRIDEMGGEEAVKAAVVSAPVEIKNGKGYNTLTAMITASEKRQSRHGNIAEEGGADAGMEELIQKFLKLIRRFA